MVLILVQYKNMLIVGLTTAQKLQNRVFPRPPAASRTSRPTVPQEPLLYKGSLSPAILRGHEILKMNPSRNHAPL